MKKVFTIALIVMLASFLGGQTLLAQHQPGQEMQGMSCPMKEHQDKMQMCGECMMMAQCMEEMQMMGCMMECPNAEKCSMNMMGKEHKMHNQKERSSK